MDAVINRFIYVLKRSGIRISPAESIDAMQALACVSLVDRDTAKAALGATLIKDIHDAPVFEELFALFFGQRAAAELAPLNTEPEVSEASALPQGKRVVLDTEDDGIPIEGGGTAAPSDTLKIQPGSLEAFAHNLVVKRARAMLDQLMQNASHQVNIRSARASAKPGVLNFADGMPALDGEFVLTALEQLLGDVGEQEVDDSLIEQLQAVTDAAHLPASLLRYLEKQLALRAERKQRMGQRPPSGPAHSFSEANRQEMEEIVRRLGRRIRGAHSYRRVISQRGRIHAARTLRRSMRYDGIPFTPILTGKRDERPRIVVVCDVSLSVRNTARFMLHLAYSLQALFEEVRSFIFVADLADISTSFEQLSIDDAIASVFDSGLIDCDVNSNYGQALGQFIQRHLGAVTNQTTVIILGDGRGNRNPPNVAALEEIRRRSKQLVWLSPEPRGSWGLGSSDMPLYAPVCHRAEVVRNLTQLGEVVDALMCSHSIRACHG